MVARPSTTLRILLSICNENTGKGVRADSCTVGSGGDCTLGQELPLGLDGCRLGHVLYPNSSRGNRATHNATQAVTGSAVRSTACAGALLHVFDQICSQPAECVNITSKHDTGSRHV